MGVTKTLSICYLQGYNRVFHNTRLNVRLSWYPGVLTLHTQYTKYRVIVNTLDQFFSTDFLYINMITDTKIKDKKVEFTTGNYSVVVENPIEIRKNKMFNVKMRRCFLLKSRVLLNLYNEEALQRAS